MSAPIPFEALHFQEAVLMQYIFASGWIIKETSDGVMFTAIPVKLKRRQKPSKYAAIIQRIRNLPDRILIP